MDYFSRAKPNLIDPKLKKTINKIIKKNPSDYTISNWIADMIKSFYRSYIKNNKLIVTVIIIIIVFLTHRYYKAKKRKEQFQSEFGEDDFLMNDINNQTKHLRYDTQPSFNRLYSVKGQHQKVTYPADPLPIRLPNEGIQYRRDIYNEDVKEFPHLNTPNYDYNNVYKSNSRSYYNGTYNTYKNAKDTEFVNPLGFSNAFNTTTGKFVGGMTDKNEKVVTDYREIIDNMEDNLIDSLKIGPKYLDVDNLDMEIEPPYTDF